MSNMRIGGLASGMDIDSIVEKLMVAERMPMDKLEQQKQIYEWQRDAYRDVNKKMTTFDTYIADNFILKSLNTKTATSSNSDLVSAVATGSASGSLTIEGVSQLAKAARGIGTQIDATSSTKVSSLFTSDMPKSFTLKAIDSQGKLGEAVSISIDASTTIGDLISKINGSNAGVTALFENGRLSLTAKNTGEEINGNDAMWTDSDGLTLFSKLGLSKLVTEDGKNAVFQVNGIATERTTNAFSMNGYNITLKSTFNENSAHNKFTSATSENLTFATKNLIDALSKIAETYDVTSMKTATTALTTASAVKVGDKTAGELYDALSEEEKTALGKLNVFSEDKNAAFTTINKDNFAALKDVHTHTQKVLDEREAVRAKIVSEVNEHQTSVNTEESLLAKAQDVEVDVDDGKVKAGELYDALAEEVKTALGNVTSYDKFIEEQEAALEKIDASNFADVKAAFEKINAENFAALKAVHTHTKNLDSATTKLNNAKEAAATFTKNEEIYTNAKKTLEDLMSVTPTTTVSTGAVTMTASTNIDEIMGKVKEFVATYNGFIKDLTDKTKEATYRDFKPLTALQKKEMEENEVKLWEEKAKSGLLRNDSIIASGLSSLRGLVYQTNHAVTNQKYNALFTIGIGTSKDYNSGGTLEIDETKLRKALEEDPDAVVQLLTMSGEKSATVAKADGTTVQSDTRGFMRKIRDELDKIEKKIDERAGRASMADTQYTLGKYLKNVDQRLDSWKSKLASIEDRYWKQFGAMEAMINKSNNQSAQLMSQYY